MNTPNYLQDNPDYIKKVSQLLMSDNPENIELGFQIVKGAGTIPVKLYPMLTNNRYKVVKCLEYSFTDLLQSRKKINLNYLRLKRLPLSLLQLKSLQHLGLAGNAQLNHPQTFELLAQMPSLEAVDLYSWHLTEVPKALFNLHTIKHLGLGANPHLNLDLVFTQLKDLPQLESLSLYNNKLKTLPQSIVLLDQLKTLDLSDNYFEGLPEVIRQMPRLKHLELCDNRGTDYWDHFWDMDNDDARKLQKEFPNIVITFG
ncbi:hypothetical protein [uncultured Microscilla sp.]|uniref:leucine-rich repeat domain-containing protein n=1 Tax=uncultured Microscilla sp. TaxID=432653 RepID=UPI00260EE633|nr:hypothetical protein [uncultured Microscilla sp.]